MIFRVTTATLPRLGSGRNGKRSSRRNARACVVESEQATLAARDSLASQIGDVMRDALASDAPF